MKSRAFLVFAATIAGSSLLSRAATVLSQNFDTDPVNFTGSPFAVQPDNTTKYYAPSNTAGIGLNAGISGNATTYFAVQNIDADAGATFPYTTTTPPQLDFTVSAAGFTDLRLSIDVAGMPTVEVENYVRAFVDVDGDGFYETPIFNFVGSNNSPYIDATLGALSGVFATFSNISLPSPTAVDGMLRLRFEIFNDTQSLNEASGIDNILISGTVPEPATAASGLLALGALWMRRRR